MKAFAEKVFSVKTGVFVFFSGTATLFFPHISGWTDIVFPQIAIFWIIPYFLWKFSFTFFFGLSVINLIALLFLKASIKTNILSAAFSAIMIISFLSIYPSWATDNYLGVDQRVSFFAVGGQTRILWAGGMENIRNDATSLLSEKTDDEGYVDPESWSSSLKKLGAYAIEVDRETHSVIIYIPKAEIFDSDQFIYLITDDESPAFSVLKRDNYRYWELDKGIYFFQTW